VQLQVVAGRLDPVDLAGAEERHAPGALDDEPVGRRGALGAELGGQREHAARERVALLVRQLGPDALERLLEAGLVERLEQVVEGAHLEGAQRVGLVSGDEHHEREALAADRLHHGKPVPLGHLHVEEHQVRRLAPDGLDGRPPVAALGDHLHVRLAGQQRNDRLAPERLVVHDDRPDGHDANSPTAGTAAAGGASRHGMTRRTVRPRWPTRQNSN